ncbi:MAG: transglycosylase SLT domain-containing protein [Acidimicrobiales bacterium]|nr:transglycosylase SLT domain-containing protein [Acidimicrobiales bacterium]
MATFIVFLSVASVVISLTGPNEQQSLGPAISQDNPSPQIETSKADSESSNAEKRETREEQQGEIQETLITEKIDVKDEVDAPKKSSTNIPEDQNVSSSSFIPNYVGQGEEMELVSSFTPVQQASLTPSQPAPAPTQPTPTPQPPEESSPSAPEINETFIPNVERWRDDVVAAIAAYGGPSSDVDLFLTIMHRESRGQPEATNSLSGAAGLMQHMPQYWDQRAISAGYSGASPYDPIANINVSAWLLYQARGGGWVHWSTY